METVKKKLVIAIDGPGGVGKSTIARLAARALGILYVNTGAMYRAIALAARDEGIDAGDDAGMERFCGGAVVVYEPASETISVNGRDYTEEIKTESAGSLASIASQKRPVRELLVRLQREFGAKNSVVMEGRDIGTIVFPDATVKFFLDAPLDIRAGRRELELREKSGNLAHSSVLQEIRGRDARDSNRKDSPLQTAPDAVCIDTGGLTIDMVLEKVLKEIRKRTA